MPQITQTPQAAEIRQQIAETFKNRFNDMVKRGDIESEPITVPPVPGAEIPVDIEIPKVEVTETPTVSEAKPKKDKSGEQKLAGKFKDVPALETGYSNLLGQTTVISKENTELKARLAAIEGELQSRAAATQTKSADPKNGMDWTHNAAVAAFAENTGVDAPLVAKLAESIAEATSQSTEQIISQMLQPIQVQARADQYIRTTYPEALQHTAEIDLFLKANPKVQGSTEKLMRAGEVEAAIDYVWPLYLLSQGSTTHKKMEANAAVAEEERVAARADAGLPSKASGTPVHGEQDAGVSDEQVEAWKAAAARGSQEAQVHLRRVYAAPILKKIHERESWDRAGV